MIASATNGALDKFGVSVGYPGMVTIAREDSDAIEVGGCDFMMWLFDGAKGFASALNMIRGERGAMASKC
jgi:hypothetical protein